MAKKDFEVTYAKFDLTKMIDVLNDANKRVANNEVKSYKRTVENWENKPKFTVEVSSYHKGLIDYEVVTDSLIYMWVDEGTEPHVISTNGSYPLRYQEGYNPKSERGRLSPSSDGSYYGKEVTPYSVLHSGIESRDFTENIKIKAYDRWSRAIETEIKHYVGKKVK